VSGNGAMTIVDAMIEATLPSITVATMSQR